MNVYDADVTSYDYAVLRLNKRVMDGRNLWCGVGSKRTVAAHELGHFLGLAHSSSEWLRGTVMAQQGQERNVIGPSCLDHQSVKVRW